MAKKKRTFQPYTMHCPKCKTGIRIKRPDLIGTRINCPKCTKKIEIVTAEEDGYIPYGVETAPEPEPEPEPTEEEIREAEQVKKKEKRKKNTQTTVYVLSILWYLVLLGGICWAFWEFVIKDYGKGEEEPAVPALVEPVHTDLA